jgi:hypothetical protein
MPDLINANLSVYRLNQNDIFSDGRDGSSAANAGAQVFVAEALGQGTDVPAASNAGTGSLIALIKRFLVHFFSVRLIASTTLSVSGDSTVLPAPPAGQEIVITMLRCQSASATSTNVLLKRGTADANPLRLRTTGDGTGISEVYGATEAIHCGNQVPFVVNLSGANAHQISILYYLANVATGLPV